MDFITYLPRTLQQYDIWVVLDRLIKSTHVLPLKRFYSDKDYTRLYIYEMVNLHGVPL